MRRHYYQYDRVFFGDYSYGCSACFLCSPASISQKDRSQHEFMSQETSTGEQKNRFCFCFLGGINFLMFLVESMEHCFWTYELFCLIGATVVLSLYPTAGSKRYLKENNILAPTPSRKSFVVCSSPY